MFTFVSSEIFIVGDICVASGNIKPPLSAYVSATGSSCLCSFLLLPMAMWCTCGRVEV